MEKLIKGTHHISIKANGKAAFDETVKFYHEILGMPFIRIAFCVGPCGEEVEFFCEK